MAFDGIAGKLNRLENDDRLPRRAQARNDEAG
jgi:hypothetical protein